MFHKIWNMVKRANNSIYNTIRNAVHLPKTIQNTFALVPALLMLLVLTVIRYDVFFSTDFPPTEAENSFDSCLSPSVFESHASHGNTVTLPEFRLRNSACV